MQDRNRSGTHTDVLFDALETVRRYHNGIIADRYRTKNKLSIVIRRLGLFPIGKLGLQCNRRSVNGPVLRIVNDPAYRSKYCRVKRARAPQHQYNQKTNSSSHMTFALL